MLIRVHGYILAFLISQPVKNIKIVRPDIMMTGVKTSTQMYDAFAISSIFKKYNKLLLFT